MFLNHVKRLRLNTLSLVTKLMVFYSVSTIGLLGTLCLFLYPTLIKMIETMHGNPTSHLTIECYERIMVGLLLTSLAAILLGHLIARNGLSKLREFESKMEMITAHSLNERININEWPKELNLLGERFNGMLDRIQVSFNQLTQCSADIAHEIRTPIHNLRVMTELALLKEKSVDEYRDILESSMHEYQYLSKLIENLLFIARSDHGQINLQKKQINVHQDINHICDFYQAMVEDNHIELVCYGQANIAVDPILFHRVISNLLSNAIRHTPAQGKISIHIQSLESAVKISIQDNGSGIETRHLPNLFDRFYRVDLSRCSFSGGLGLGLAIVKSIIDLHGGTINIESHVNQGTCIHMTFPLV